MKRTDPMTQNEIDYCDHVRFVLINEGDDLSGWPVEEINRTAREAYARRLNVWACVNAFHFKAAEQRDAA